MTELRNSVLVPVEELDLDEATAKAIALRRKGVPIVHAADVADANVASVVKAADALGLLDSSEDELESLTARLAMKAGLRLEGLIDDPEQKLTVHELGVTMGINTDKFVKFGELKVKRAAGSNDNLGAAAQLLAKLHESGGATITVTAQIEGPDDSGTIDVEAAD